MPLTPAATYPRGEPKLGAFKAWLLERGVAPSTASAVVTYARMGFQRLGWAESAEPRLGARLIGNYLRTLPATEHALFRHAWGRFRQFSVELGKDGVPEAPGGHGSAYYTTNGRELAQAIVNLLAYWPRGVSVKRSDLSALTWRDVAIPIGSPTEPIAIRFRGNYVAFAARHAALTFEPLLRWSQPWAAFNPPDEIALSGPLVAARPGMLEAMPETAMRRVLGEHGFPVTRSQANSWLLRRELEAGHEADQQTADAMARNRAIEERVEALAKGDALEQLWDTTFPDAPRAAKLTAEQAGMLGVDAVVALDRRERQGFYTALGAQVTERVERADQIAAELGNEEVIAARAAEMATIAHSDRGLTSLAGHSSQPPPLDDSPEPLLVWPSERKGS